VKASRPDRARVAAVCFMAGLLRVVVSWRVGPASGLQLHYRRDFLRALSDEAESRVGRFRHLPVGGCR